ncbi:hypothetical protein EPO05_05060 [Patescibacteria group bacterium]|nr:MAG: hypothetical protein EPO05_05060 [Patescibacteria group bacterium]
MTLNCQQLHEQLQNLSKLKVQFDAALEAGDVKAAEGASELLERCVSELFEQTAPSSCKVTFSDPETHLESEIDIDIESALYSFANLYVGKLDLEIDYEKVRDIWRRNYREIKREMAKYGYSRLLIVPDDLPDEATLNQKLVETGFRHQAGRLEPVHKTHQYAEFKVGGSFQGLRSPEEAKYRLILTHRTDNVHHNQWANPFLKATLGKGLDFISSLNLEEINRRVEQGEKIPVNFEVQINGSTYPVRAEGLSLKTYLLLQGVCERESWTHLDTQGSTWLPGSFSGPRIVFAFWNEDSARFEINAGHPSLSDDVLACRFGKSFE